MRTDAPRSVLMSCSEGRKEATQGRSEEATMYRQKGVRLRDKTNRAGRIALEYWQKNIRSQVSVIVWDGAFRHYLNMDTGEVWDDERDIAFIAEALLDWQNR